MCLPLSLAQSKTITPALSDQLSFPFDPNNFVSWFFCWCLQLFVCLFFGILCLLVDPVPPITRLSFTPTTYLDLVGAKSVFSRKIICNLLCIVFVIVFTLVFVFLIILISLEPRAYYQQQISEICICICICDCICIFICNQLDREGAKGI